MRKKVKLVVFTILFFIITACASSTNLLPGSIRDRIEKPLIFIPQGLSTETPFLPSTFTPTATLTPTVTATATQTPTQTATPTPTASPTPIPMVLVGAGDISICGQDGDNQTADLLDKIPGTVFTAGDNSNEDGTLKQYIDCFDPSWGRHKDRMRPSPGNHDYFTDRAADYFDYFGSAAGEIDNGYYSYDLGDWHIIALNSNCGWVECGADSSQVAWLKEDLSNSDAKCTLAYWHHPRWSSGKHGNSPWLDPFWQVLYDYGAEVVISGHDHHYERFAPLNPDGEVDESWGIRQFIVGTGGVSQRGFGDVMEGSEVRNSGAFGVIRFNLYPDSYEWEFIPIEGEEFTDHGVGTCH